MSAFFWAHSGSPDDRSDWQGLAEHLLAVARIAGENARPLGLEAAANAAGLLHDLGKYDPDFDRVLRSEQVRIDHSTAGAAVLLNADATPLKAAAELLAYCILGHHAGLDRGVPEIIGFLLGDEDLDIVAQRALVAFEGEDVVGAPVEDLVGDGALAAHGVDGHDGALDGQQVEQLRDRHDLVGLVGDPGGPGDSRCRTWFVNLRPANFTTIKHIALNLIRRAPGKDSLRLKRKLAAWDDHFLASIIAR